MIYGKHGGKSLPIYQVAPEVPMKLRRWLEAALSDEEIGQWVQVYRKDAGLTTRELAPFLNLSSSAVRYREIGRMHWTPETVTETLAAIEKAALQKRKSIPS